MSSFHLIFVFISPPKGFKLHWHDSPHLHFLGTISTPPSSRRSIRHKTGFGSRWVFPTCYRQDFGLPRPQGRCCGVIKADKFSFSSRDSHQNTSFNTCKEKFWPGEVFLYPEEQRFNTAGFVREKLQIPLKRSDFIFLIFSLPLHWKMVLGQIHLFIYISWLFRQKAFTSKALCILWKILCSVCVKCAKIHGFGGWTGLLFGFFSFVWGFKIFFFFSLFVFFSFFRCFLFIFSFSFSFFLLLVSFFIFLLKKNKFVLYSFFILFFLFFLF